MTRHSETWKIGRRKPLNKVSSSLANREEETTNQGLLPAGKSGGGNLNLRSPLREEETTLLHKGKEGGMSCPPPPPSLSLRNKRLSLTLPYPPTVNHYWETRVVRRGSRFVPSVYVRDEGRRYQRSVARLLDGVPKFAGRVRVQILVQPPDQRARDLDNVLKCLLDSMTKAGLWGDDSQVDSLLVVRGDQVDGGSILVFVEDL
jgi:crossover junction endodeoxyribonuclease RusA